MAKNKREIITGIEIGTSAVKVVMGEFLPNDVLAILGAGEAPSVGVCKGEIENAELAGDQLRRAVKQAEESSGLEITELVFLAVTGGHIQTVNNVGTAIIQNPDRRIDDEAVIQAAQAARGYTLVPNKDTLLTTERGYRIDDEREVTNPLGLIGSKLETEVQIVYGDHNRLETSFEVLEGVMGFPPDDIAFSAVASALAVFDPDPGDRWELLIDIGAGVSEYVVFNAHGCYHCGQLTVGCEHIANDLSIGLRLPMVTARAILIDMEKNGCSAVMTPDGRARQMTLEDIGRKKRHIPRSSIERIVELRLRELFEVIRDTLAGEGVLERLTGIRLCGGGALIPGVTELAGDVFRPPVSPATPRLLSGKEDILKSPRYITPVGLVRWGKFVLETEKEKGEKEVGPVVRLGRLLRTTLDQVRDALHW
jgi:cell division protein FtsA